jgi:hypothetical protein
MKNFKIRNTQLDAVAIIIYLAIAATIVSLVILSLQAAYGSIAILIETDTIPRNNVTQSLPQPQLQPPAIEEGRP